MTEIHYGDLVEVISPIPWDDEKPVGTRLLVEGEPFSDESFSYDFPEITGDLVEVSDPMGMWSGGDPVPISHLKLVKAGVSLIPTAGQIADSLHMGLLGADETVVKIFEVGQQSEDGSALYALGRTPEGVAIQFEIQVSQVWKAEM